MDHMGILSLIPPLLAILLAIITRNVLISLFTSVYIGVLILVGGRPLEATLTTIGDFLFPQLTDSYNAAVLVLLFFIGGFVGLMEKSGGGAALAAKASKFINTRVKAQIGAWIGGIIIFFSDLGTPLIVGPVFEKIFDKLKVSREKLAWIIDSTSSPVAVLIPFIGWGVYIMGLMKTEFDKLNIQTSEFTAFIEVIPFQFYAILTVIMVPLVALTKHDFGAMRKAEERVINTGQIYWPTSNPLRRSEAEQDEATNSKAIFVWLPILVLFVTLFGLLISYGFPTQAVSGSDFRVALSTAYLFSAITLAVLMIAFKVKNFAEVMNIYTAGMQKMVYVAGTLVLAWALGKVMGEMGTSEYIVEMLRGSIPSYIVPALIFLVGVVISLASGTSWGTFAIMLPIAIPMAIGLDAHLYVCIGAVLSGGIFGDHCSPISDTSILSSTGAGTDHVDHVKTQIQYAIISGTIAFISYIIAGITGQSWTVLISIVLLIITLFIISRFNPKKLNTSTAN